MGFPHFKVLGSTVMYEPEVMQSAAGCYHTPLTKHVISVDATDGSAGTAILQRRKGGGGGEEKQQSVTMTTIHITIF